jgi:signal transduction histidine kinase
VRLLAQRDKGGMWALVQNVDNDYEICIYKDNVFEPQFKIEYNKMYYSDVGYPVNLFESSKGDLWVCGGYGLGRYANGEWQTFEHSIYKSVIEFSDGILWFARSDGIFQYDGLQFTPILTGVDEVNSLVISRDSSVWAGTHSGLYRFHENSWVQITEEDGLPDTIVHEVYEDSQGKLWVGTAKGFCFWNPDADRDIPLVTIPEDKNSRSISPDGNAQFVLDGIDKWNYTKPERLLYSYRIDDNKWSNFSTDKVASCSGMLSGPHLLQVKSMDRNWNQSKVGLWTFVVLLPWYKEPIFIFIITIASILIVLLGGVAMYRRKQVLQSYAEIQSANSQLNDLNVELQDANAQLIQLDQMKSQFVSQASHDLRTPLTAIKGSLDNLLMGIAGALNEKQQKVMTRATTSVDRLTNLINDVLDLNRIETGRVVLEKTDIPFKALVENIISENRPAAEQKQIQLAFVSSEDDCTLHIDGSKIERVVGELVSNAIKYTPESGMVSVSLIQDDNEASLSVKDSGIGMTEEECAKIWERFYRTSASQKFAKGSGLGLSIAKELIELHNGSIELISEQGLGTTFKLTLPRK